MSVRIFGFISLALAFLPACVLGQGKPPTLDPTYGFPLPKHSAARKALPPDAHWIWAATTQDVQTVYARHILKLAKQARVQVYITADNYFTLYVNGQKVGGTTPVANNDEVWRQVHQYDITSMLKPGDNEIAVEAVNAGGLAGLLARVQVDSKPELFTDNTWKLTDTKPSEGWTAQGFDDSSWPSARDLGPAQMSPWDGQLDAWPAALNVPPDYLYDLPLPPLQVSYAPDIDHISWLPTSKLVRGARPAGVTGVWKLILDFGQELTGRVIVNGYQGPIEIGTGESIGEAIEHPYKMSASSTSPYSAFRYAVLAFPPETDKFYGEVTLDHLYYPVQYRGSFDCSDPLLTKIWYTGAYTAHLCMQQDIWDAPKRDRARWMGDLHVSGEVINNVFADKFLMEQTMLRLREDAQGGSKPGDPPRSNVNGIPGYSCAWVAGLADLYRHIGDRAFLESQHSALVGMLEYLHGELGDNGTFANKHGQWPFVDWSPEFDGDHPLARVATHLFMVKAAREAAFLLNELGDSANAAKASQWGDDLTAAAQKQLVGDGGTFGDRRQASAMAIYSGVANPTEERAIYDQVLKPGNPAWSIVVSPYYNNYVIFALSMAGHTQDATDFIRSYWGGMLAEGATSWWEGYDPTWDKTNFHAHLQADDGTGYFVSLCHGWSAGPTNFLTERVLGIRSTGAGFRTCDIAPDLGDLSWATGSVPTPEGTVKVRADKAGSGITLRLDIPRGVSASVTPGGTISTVDGRTHSGTTVLLGPGKHTVSATE
jgi:alpha-L-rhamnosidase